MPQMSPMSWIFLSLYFFFICFIFKSLNMSNFAKNCKKIKFYFKLMSW